MKRREFIALVGGAAAGYPTVAPAQPATQSDALNTYNKAVNDFRSILGRRRAQIDSKQPLPDLPGQDLYLARNKMMSAYKDLTDAVPAKIGRPKRRTPRTMARGVRKTAEGRADQAAESISFLVVSTRPFTAATDLSKAAFSSALNWTSTIRSTPSAPITTGTPM